MDVAARRKARARSVAVAAVLTAVLLVASSPAHAVVALAGPGGFAAGYLTPVTAAPVGGPLMFVNGDIQPHNVIATSVFLPKKVAKKTEWCKGYKRKECPIFWSETVAAGQSTPVLGLENIESGQQYEFFCSIHPNMIGTLVAL